MRLRKIFQDIIYRHLAFGLFVSRGIMVTYNLYSYKQRGIIFENLKIFINETKKRNVLWISYQY